jgi:gag-polypeptide of LTR copia-type
MSSNNGINKVPVFSGANFRTWQQTMGDYLRSMRLFRHVSGATVKPTPVVPPTQANLDAIAAWDEADEQAQGILGLRLSTNLRTHLGATAHASWQALDNAFGQPGISSIYADLQATLHVKISGGQNLQVEMQRLLTLFERLHANGMAISDPIQGMMLLNALPPKWDGVSMVYLQGQNVLANVTFASVRDAIIAEFERTSRPSSLAVQKISAVKRKGKSPTFKEQTRTYQLSAPKASGDAPQGAPDKKKRRGGKKAKVHAIVSSALIPESVAKRLQESHHVEAPAASPTPAYRTGIVVGGPSRAPISVPSTIASINNSGISYRKVEPPKSALAYTGLPSKPGPNSLTKAMRKAELHLGTLPASEQNQFADIGVFNPSSAKAIEGACQLTARLAAEEAEKLASSARRLVITDNAVASGSSTTLEDLPACPLLERLTTPPPSEVEPLLPPKKVRKRARKNKGKKDSVHSTPVDPDMGNVRIFPDQARVCDLYNDYELTAPKSNFSNPLAENGETLFQEPVQNHENPYNLNEVNPRHPHAAFYQRLMVSFEQEQ